MTKKLISGTVHTPSMQEKTRVFQAALLPYYAEKRRDMPWRQLAHDDDARFYQILVSEMMLQQTQVSRVTEKYLQWMVRFPDLTTLARAPFTDVLSQWSGLGYSRRAKYLHDIAQELSGDRLPQTTEELVKYKGIGTNTAGAILAYYANIPTVFIETNIRTVVFHHFFADDFEIGDARLNPLIEELLDRENPRLWYWAMMDYGADLKKQVRNISKSKHYRKQSPFEGSDRQLRSALLRRLLESPILEADALTYVESKQSILNALQKEGMVVRKRGYLHLPE